MKVVSEVLNMEYFFQINSVHRAMWHFPVTSKNVSDKKEIRRCLQGWDFLRKPVKDKMLCSVVQNT